MAMHYPDLSVSQVIIRHWIDWSRRRVDFLRCGSQMKRTNAFVEYSGETSEELFSYPATRQYDALVRAFREGIQQKAARKGERSLSYEERVVLAVEALEQEVNNGGYDQFFCNSSRTFAPMIVDSLVRIGCKRTAKITQRALHSLHFSTLTVARIEAAMAKASEERDQELDRCDQLFYKTPQGIPKRLYAFIKVNRSRINF